MKVLTLLLVTNKSFSYQIQRLQKGLESAKYMYFLNLIAESDASNVV